MASFDSEHAFFVNRVRANTFRLARDGGASLISRPWMAKMLNLNETFLCQLDQCLCYRCRDHGSSRLHERLTIRLRILTIRERLMEAVPVSLAGRKVMMARTRFTKRHVRSRF